MDYSFFPSPPASSIDQPNQAYPPFPTSSSSSNTPTSTQQQQNGRESLSLNLSSLSVGSSPASPAPSLQRTERKRSFTSSTTPPPTDDDQDQDMESSPTEGPPGSATIGVLGKPMPTNNFVTKLYQMISDPKSAHFIAWTELGTSFVVSNVGEFSRSILGSHFKHNNFSSFVRQLNMYGFHKINRTPRAQRTSTDSQTWEFSHHKFLRGRPDLLDEIKRKALEPDLGAKHRVELPGEVAAQLAGMRDDNRRMWDALVHERRKVERLTNVVARLWDFVGKGFPGSLPQFPAELSDSPSPSSPNPPQHFSNHNHNHNHMSSISPHPHSSLPSPNPGIYITSPAPPPMLQYNAHPGGGDRKRPRIDTSSSLLGVGMGGGISSGGMGSAGTHSPGGILSAPPHTIPEEVVNVRNSKKFSTRARSDSAPLGHQHSYSQGGGGYYQGPGPNSWGVPQDLIGRPRSGGGLVGGGGMQNIGNLGRDGI
ncbi:HSF-type DNA-binding-domain-containing protein [Armillaria mellea]|nr:HSF-type DNA-binding-domain-containing protein [Armillaria mellea]